MSFSKLYDYQLTVLEESRTFDKGQFLLPTGTGKTFCQAAIIAKDILESEEAGVYSVCCPRILLSYQLFEEIYKFLISEGIDAEFDFIHSDGITKAFERKISDIRKQINSDNNTDISFCDISNNRCTNTIAQSINRANSRGKAYIAICVYDSAPKLYKAVKDVGRVINISIHDEAHYLTEEENSKLISSSNFRNVPNKTFFFTATARHGESEVGRGMNNHKIFGDVLFEMTPGEAVALGKMVRPNVLEIVPKDLSKEYTYADFKASIPSLIREGYLQHQRDVYRTSLEEAKLMVSISEVDDIIRFEKTPEYIDLRKRDVEIFVISSRDDVKNKHNLDQINKKQWLTKLQETGLDPNKRMIALHYDILKEGIDVPGFTGIFPLRCLGMSDLLQTYGRCARLHPADRKAFAEGSYTHNDLDRMKKPYGWVLIAKVSKEVEDKVASISMITEHFKDFDIDLAETISMTNKIGSKDIEEDEDHVVPNVSGEAIEEYNFRYATSTNGKLNLYGVADKFLNPKPIVSEEEATRAYSLFKSLRALIKG